MIGSLFVHSEADWLSGALVYLLCLHKDPQEWNPAPTRTKCGSGVV